MDRIISHLGRTEAFLIVFLTCVAICLPALGVPDLKGEEVRRILPAVAAALNSLVPDHEPIHVHKPGCQQFKDRSAIPSQLGHRSTASPTGSKAISKSSNG